MADFHIVQERGHDEEHKGTEQQGHGNQSEQLPVHFLQCADEMLFGQSPDQIKDGTTGRYCTDAIYRHKRDIGVQVFGGDIPQQIEDKACQVDRDAVYDIAKGNIKNGICFPGELHCQEGIRRQYDI